MTIAPTALSASSLLPVVYECPECGQRQLERRCPDCNLFTRRLGHGGLCPHCDELVTLTDLTEAT